MLPASRWTPSSRAQPRAALERRAAVELLGARRELVGAAEQVPLLRQRDQLGAVGGRRRRPGARRRSRLRALSVVELSWIAAARIEDPFLLRPIGRREPID